MIERILTKSTWRGQAACTVCSGIFPPEIFHRIPGRGYVDYPTSLRSQRRNLNVSMYLERQEGLRINYDPVRVANFLEKFSATYATCTAIYKIITPVAIEGLLEKRTSDADCWRVTFFEGLGIATMAAVQPCTIPSTSQSYGQTQTSRRSAGYQVRLTGNVVIYSSILQLTYIN